jgi:hypothetical protein
LLGNLKTPDVTMAQLIAAVAWLAMQLVGMGLIDENTSQLLVQVGSTVVAGVWVIADAIIRNGRARALINPPKPLEPDGGGGV